MSVLLHRAMMFDLVLLTYRLLRINHHIHRARRQCWIKNLRRRRLYLRSHQIPRKAFVSSLLQSAQVAAIANLASLCNVAVNTHFDPTPQTTLIVSTSICFNPPTVCGSNLSTFDPLLVKFACSMIGIEAILNQIEALV